MKNIDSTAYEVGQISVKFKEAYFSSIEKKISKKNGVVSFGITELDYLNKKLQVTEATYLFTKQNEQKKPLHELWGFNRWLTLTLFAKANIKEVVASYLATNYFEVVEPVYKIITTATNNQLTYLPNDTRFTEQWSLNNTGQSGGTIGKDMQLNNAWDLEKGKPEVIVAMLDRGIQFNHPDLIQNMWPGIGYNFVTNSNILTPEDHGTATAGIVGATTNNSIGISGIAGGNGLPNSGIRLMSCQVIAGATNGGFEQAFVWAADNGACITSNSWVFANAGVYRQSILDAIDYFCNNGGGNVLQGGLCIFAAGNNGEERLTYPGCYERVIGVSSTNNKDIKSGFSNYGNWVDISAPGGDGTGTATDILTTGNNNSYAFFSGTSACTPQVAGVAALIASKLSGKASASDIRNILLTTTNEIYSLNQNFIGKLGAGRVNAFKALQKAETFLQNYIVAAPQNFKGISNCNTVDLSWTASSNEVIIATSNNYIGLPMNGIIYNVGDNLPNGDIIIYKGKANNFNASINNNNVFQYFKIWAIGTNNSYSFGRQVEVLTGPVYTINDDIIYKETFDGLNFPYQYLRRINPDNSTTWIRTEDAKNSENYSVVINNFSYTNVGQIDLMYLPIMAINKADSIKLSFYKAYQTNSRADSLAILLSTDCGKTFSTVWQKGGNQLATVTSTSNTSYTPFSTDWKQENITFAVPNTANKILIGIKAINGNGQNLYVDDITVTTKTLPQKLKDNGVLITPNPFINKIVVQHYFPPTNLRAISIFNIVGQKVFAQNFNGNASSTLEITTQNLPKGIYEIRLDYTDKSFSQKLLK